MARRAYYCFCLNPYLGVCSVVAFEIILCLIIVICNTVALIKFRGTNSLDKQVFSKMLNAEERFLPDWEQFFKENFTAIMLLTVLYVVAIVEYILLLIGSLRRIPFLVAQWFIIGFLLSFWHLVHITFYPIKINYFNLVVIFIRFYEEWVVYVMFTDMMRLEAMHNDHNRSNIHVQYSLHSKKTKSRSIMDVLTPSRAKSNQHGGFKVGVMSPARPTSGPGLFTSTHHTGRNKR